MKRTLPTVAVLALLLTVSSCRDEQPFAPNADEVPTPLLAVSDATRGGNPGFFFLPPLGPAPQTTGTFDGSLAPIVELCERTTSECSGPPLLSMDAERNGSNEFYQANLKLKDADLESGTVYRVRVLVSGNELGYVDIAVKQNGAKKSLQMAAAKGGKKGDDGSSGSSDGATDEIVEVSANQTLPVKVRIDEGAISVPTASFTVGGSPQARSATTFDASASSAPDGSALSYSWDFGDGTRGGGVQIAHVYATGGTFDVTLTVMTTAGVSASSTQTLSIAPGPAPAGSATLTGTVEASDGSFLSGVHAQVVNETPGGTTNGSGQVVLSGVGTGVPLVVRLTKGGYADQFVELTIPASESEARFTATMLPRESAAAVPSIENGASVTGFSGVRVDLPPNALVDPAGNPVTGTVDVSLTAVDVTEPDAGGFPGGFSAIETDGSPAELLSYGVAEFVLSQNGQDLDLAPGQTATIEIPISVSGVAVGDVLPLWSLDEAMGLWVREGDGTVVLSTSTPSGFALRATVSHFSWWNIDITMAPHTVALSCLENGLPVSCTVRGSFQQPGQPVRYAEEIVPASGVSVPIPSGVPVTLEAVGSLGQTIDQQMVTGAVGGTTNVTLNLVGAYAPTIVCEDGSGAPVACSIRDNGAGSQTVYEQIPIGGKTVNLLPGTPITIRGFDAFGRAGEVVAQGPPAAGGIVVIVLSETFQVDVLCRDRLGGASACNLGWRPPGLPLQTVAIGPSGGRISLPGNEQITLNATGPYGIFTATATVQGPTGTLQSLTLDLVGQGGSFCGGAPLGFPVVTVDVNADCSTPGTVSSAQEAILLVQHGGTIQFANGTYPAKRLQVPRDGLTMRSVAGQSAVVLAGTGDPDPRAYDGEGFAFVGGGDYLIENLTFRSPPAGRGGIGLISGPNNISAAGDYSSFVVDNVTFEDLRIGLVIFGTTVAGAPSTVTNSTFVNTTRVSGRGVFLISNDAGDLSATVDNNSFTSDPNLISGMWGVQQSHVSQVALGYQQVTITNNVLSGVETGLALNGAKSGSLISGNSVSARSVTARGISVNVEPGGTVTVANNVVAGQYLGGTPSDQANYSFREGIYVGSSASSVPVVQGNTVSGAHEGIASSGAAAVISGNQISESYRNIRLLTGQDGGRVEGNQILNPPGGAYGIEASASAGASVTVADNVLSGSFLGGDPQDYAQYLFGVGIQTSGDATGTITLLRNTLTGVFYGVDDRSSVAVAGTDQVIDQVNMLVYSRDAPSFTMTNSDFTNYRWTLSYRGTQGYSAGSFQCNYWGDIGGPAGNGAGDPVVTPWAIAPIANGAGGPCIGSIPQP